MTMAPAQAIGKGDTLGTLRPGTMGDAIVFKIKEGRFDLFDGSGDFVDSRWEPYDGIGKKREASRKMSILKVVTNGKPYFLMKEQ